MGLRAAIGRVFSRPREDEVRPVALGNGGYTVITTPEQLEEAIRAGNVTESGVMVTPQKAMTVSAVFACIRIRSGVVANMPMHVMRRVDDRTKEFATDHPLHAVLSRRPNRWQKPAQFKRMMETYVLLRGNAYALKVRNYRGQVTELLPINPERMKVEQADDLTLKYTYTRKDGRQQVFSAGEILHLFNLTLDGFTGVTPLTYARETVGAAISMEKHGANVFKNGARVSGILSHPKKIGKESLEFLRASMEDFRSGGAREGKDLILEEGMSYSRMGMTAEDAQWIQSRQLTNSDIYRFFGVPPHMAGDTEKSTSWGTGLEEQTNGFVAFTAEDDITMWEQACTVDLLDGEKEGDLYVAVRRESLVRANVKTQVESGLKEVQMGAITVNEYRERRDLNPIEGGDTRYPPPNQTLKDDKDEKEGKADDAEK